MGQVEKAFLAAEETLLCEVSRLEEVPAALLATFYVLNTNFPPSAKNFYHLLETIYIEKVSQKVSPSLSSFVASLASH